MQFISRIRSQLTYPNIGVTVCLFLLIALLGAGQAYAVATITGEDVVDQSLGAQDLATDSVGFRATQFGSLTGLHIQNKSLGPSDINYGYEVVGSTSETLSHGAVRHLTARCTAGKKVLGGGFNVAPQNIDGVWVTLSEPTSDRSGWLIAVYNLTSTAVNVKATATCASLS